MVADHLVDDETQEFLAEFRIKIGRLGKRSKARDLTLLAVGIGWRQGDLRFVLAHSLRNPKPLGEHMNQRGINVVDALAIDRENRVGFAFIGGRIGNRCG